MNKSLCWKIGSVLLLTCSIIFTQTVFAQNVKKIALVIGNTDYKNIKNPRLKNPENDAIGIARSLREIGFTIVRPVQKNSDAQLNLSSRQLLRAKAVFKQQALDADIALLYYAGHGMQFRENESAYILPVDVEEPPGADADQVDYSVQMESMEKGSISLTEWVDELKAQNLPGKTKLTIAVYDACREIPGTTRSIFDGGGAFRGVVRSKTRNASRHFDLIAYSAAEGQFAADGSGQNSPYSQELIYGLKNEASLEVYDFFRNIQTRVRQRINQSPVLSPSDMPNDTFYLAQAGPVVKQAKEVKTTIEPFPISEYFEPEMVRIPGGRFQMGCVSGRGCDGDEKPVHRVSVPKFYMSKTEVTFEQWDFCVKDGGCSYKPDDEGWGRGKRPVINVSWDDAQQYVKWLRGKTGRAYRLPSEAEWEYAARAGSKTRYHWGNDIDCSRARYGYYSDECGKQKSTDSVGSFSANAFGLYDMHGNVWEWVQDCYHKTYEGAPDDGSAWENGCYNFDDGVIPRVLRGGSWYDLPTRLRSANRIRVNPDGRFINYGFRIARTN